MQVCSVLHGCAVLGEEINEGGEFKSYSGSFFLIFKYSYMYYSINVIAQQIHLLPDNSEK